MKPKLILFTALLAFCFAVTLIAADAKTFEKSRTGIVMPGDSSTMVGEVAMLNALKVTGIAGEIIAHNPSYSLGGFGTSDDSITLSLMTAFGSRTYTLETVTAALPCTLTVDNHVDTQFFGRMYLSWDWGDTVAVASDSTATSYIDFILKLWTMK